VNSTDTVSADWIAASGGISGGNFTSTCNNGGQPPVQGVWH
jgi:hypothetical protein